MKPLNISRMSFLLIFALGLSASAQQSVEVVKVISKPVERILKLPGEFAPYLSVTIHAKVTAFVNQVEVDRGSIVREGQLLASLVAPEVSARRGTDEIREGTPLKPTPPN